MIFKLDKERISLGDIISYRGVICFVTEGDEYPRVNAVALQSGLVCCDFECCDSLNKCEGVQLLIKNDDVVISVLDKEVPF